LAGLKAAGRPDSTHRTAEAGVGAAELRRRRRAPQIQRCSPRSPRGAAAYARRTSLLSCTPDGRPDEYTVDRSHPWQARATGTYGACPAGEQNLRGRGQAATRGPSPARVGRGGSLDRLRGLCGAAWPLRLRQVHAAAHPGGHALPINAAHFLIEVAHPRWQLLWRHAPPEGGPKADHQVDSSSRRAGFPQIGNCLHQRARIGLLKQIELQRGVRARHEARRSHFVPRVLAVLPSTRC